MDHAWRLTFAFDGDKFSLKSSQRILKRIQRGQSRDDMAASKAGRFVEVRGANREVLYRRAVTELLSPTVEYPTGDPARPLGRAAAPRRGSVSILVPAHADGRSVAIVDTGREKHEGSTKPRTDTPSTSVAAPRDLIVIDLPSEGGAR